MWNVTPTARWNWADLKKQIKKHGLRNSLLLAPMPTASTSQILGNNECFEPYTSNIYTRRTLSGEYVVVNKHLLNDLVNLGLWTKEIREKIIASNGSIQHIMEIPSGIRELYKTAWELSQKVLIDMSADRGAFICQSQSLNLFVENPNFAKLSSMHFYGWSKGLKTGMYYLRSKSAVDAIKFTLSEEYQKKYVTKEPDSKLTVSDLAEQERPMAQTSRTSRVPAISPRETVVAMMEEPVMVVEGVKACSLDNPDCEACSA